MRFWVPSNSIQPPRKLAVQIGLMAQSSHLGQVHLPRGVTIRQPKRKGQRVVEKRSRQPSRSEACNEGSPPPAPISKPVRYTGPLRIIFPSTPRSKLPPGCDGRNSDPGASRPTRRSSSSWNRPYVCLFPTKTSSHRTVPFIPFGGIFSEWIFFCLCVVSEQKFSWGQCPPPPLSAIDKSQAAPSHPDTPPSFCRGAWDLFIEPEALQGSGSSPKACLAAVGGPPPLPPPPGRK